MIAIIPIVIARVYQQSSSMIIDQNTQYNIELVSLLQQRVSTNYSNISNLMMNLGYDATVQKFLVENDNLTTYELSKKVESLMGVIKNTNKDILDIIIVSRTEKYTTLAGRINYATELMNTLGNDGAVHYGGFRKADPVIGRDKVLFGMNIFASGDTMFYGEKIGFITFVLDVKSINTELKQYPRLAGTSFYMMDNKELVYTNSNDEHMLGNNQLDLYGDYSEKAVIERINGKRYAIQSFELPELSGRIITTVPISNLMKELESLKKASYILLVITLLLISFPYTMLMMNILKPLTKLMKFMKSLKGGNLDVLHSKVTLEGYAEIEVISNEFNTMLERINDLTERLLDTTSKLYQKDIEKQRAEFAFLQSQINPHFLSNTLDSIKGIALVKGNRDIYEMTTALSTMMRYSIQGRDEVSLEEELKIVNAYVKIYQGRFPDKIAFEKHCADEFLSIRVPKMMIQPIVENALGHGLEPRGNSGLVLIRINKNNDGNLEITIADNGVGIEQDRLYQIIERLNNQDAASTSDDHIGIQNVHNRIQLKYGEHYGVAIDSVSGQGTEVKLTLPILPFNNSLA